MFAGAISRIEILSRSTLLIFSVYDIGKGKAQPDIALCKRKFFNCSLYIFPTEEGYGGPYPTYSRSFLFPLAIINTALPPCQRKREREREAIRRAETTPRIWCSVSASREQITDRKSVV